MYSSSDHEQVDSGLGFECDKELVGIVRLLNQFSGITTQFSCQGESVKEAYVIFCGPLSSLVDFCTDLYPLLSPMNFSDPLSRAGKKLPQKEEIDIMFNADPELGIRGKLKLPNCQIQDMERRLRELLCKTTPPLGDSR